MDGAVLDDRDVAERDVAAEAGVDVGERHEDLAVGRAVAVEVCLHQERSVVGGDAFDYEAAVGSGHRSEAGPQHGDAGAGSGLLFRDFGDGVDDPPLDGARRGRSGQAQVARTSRE